MIDFDKVGFIHKVLFIAKDDIKAWPVLPPKRIIIIGDPGCIAHHESMDEARLVVPAIDEFAASVGCSAVQVHEFILELNQIERNKRSFDDFTTDMRDELLESMVLLNDRIDHYCDAIIQEPINYPKQIKLRPVHYNAPVIKPKFIRKGNRHK